MEDQLRFDIMHVRFVVTLVDPHRRHLHTESIHANVRQYLFILFPNLVVLVDGQTHGLKQLARSTHLVLCPCTYLHLADVDYWELIELP